MIAIKTNKNTFIRPHLFGNIIERITESRDPYDLTKLFVQHETNAQEIYKKTMDWLEGTVLIIGKQIQEQEQILRTSTTRVTNLDAKLEELYLQPYGQVFEEVAGRQRQRELAVEKIDTAKHNIASYIKQQKRLETILKAQPELFNINLK